MKNFFTKQNLFLLVALVLALGITKGVSKTVFIADSPKVNPSFISYVSHLPENISISGKSFIANLTNKKDGTIKQISKGVYAGETKKVQYTQFVEAETEWDTIDLVNKSGRHIQYKYPKGTVPLQQMIDLIKSQ